MTIDPLSTQEGLPPEAVHLNFRRLLDSVSAAFMVMDRDLTIVYANAAYLQSVERELGDLVGHCVFDVFPDTENRVEEIRAVFLSVLDGETKRLEGQKLNVPQPDGTVATKFWQATHTPYTDSNGEVRYIIQEAEDITETERLAERTGLLSRELDHRVKNVFSVIQAVAALSGQRAETIDEFRNEFAARLAAMGRTHDQLRDRNWQGLYIKSIILEGLVPFCGRDSDQLNIEGPDVLLSPRGAQHASLLVHELATNAAKYGCFSVPEGRLDITIMPTDDPHYVEAEWRESGVSGVAQPSQTGFGTQLTEFMPNLVCERDYNEGGLIVRMRAYLDNAMDRAASAF